MFSSKYKIAQEKQSVNIQKTDVWAQETENHSPNSNDSLGR